MPKKEENQARHQIAIAAEEAVKAIATATDLASEKLAKAADAASSAVASATIDANRLLASQATTAAKVVDVKQGNDHDLLTRLDTKVDAIIVQIEKMDNNSARRIDNLEVEKLNCRDSYPVLYKKDVEEKLADHEKRIKYGEITDTRLMAYGVAILFILSFAQWLVGKYF